MAKPNNYKLVRINEAAKGLKDSLTMLEQQAGVDNVELLSVTLIKMQVARIEELSNVEDTQ